MAEILKQLPDPALPWTIPLLAVELIARYEGLCLEAYRCPAGTLTIGWGQTEDVYVGQKMTKAEADADLCRSIAARSEQVLSVCTRAPSRYELGAMVSLQYNIGHAGFCRSTVLRAHNAGDAAAASRAFGLWNKATVDGILQEMKGLTARRAAESAMYLRPASGSPMLRMPQVVEPESSLKVSPMAQGGATAVVAGGASVLSTVSEHMGPIGAVASQAKTLVVETVGIPHEYFGPLLLLIIGAVVLYQRHKQRVRGWA
jgi:lysozyme